MSTVLGVTVVPGRVRFPVELVPPPGFDAERLETWPRVDGRLEFVDGRLIFMPPCADIQQYTVTDVVITLGSWVRQNRTFFLATNEAGMRLGDETRAADAAIWRRADTGAPLGHLQRTPPILAVEVAGRDEDEDALRNKARWYLGHGAKAVWIVLPQTREVVVITSAADTRHSGDDTLPALAELPGLAPRARELFTQLDG
jgi:Uma2 family endonuclease